MFLRGKTFWMMNLVEWQVSFDGYTGGRWAKSVPPNLAEGWSRAAVRGKLSPFACLPLFFLPDKP